MQDQITSPQVGEVWRRKRHKATVLAVYATGECPIEEMRHSPVVEFEAGSGPAFSTIEMFRKQFPERA